MSSKRVPIARGGEPSIPVEVGATVGATVGVNLRWEDGTLVTREDLAPEPPAEGLEVTYWRMIREIPPNVVALAETTTTGLYVITGDGSSATREIQPVAGETTVSNGDGVAGDPAVGLADVSPTAGGTLQRYGFDSKGRRIEEEAADTDDLAEGASNLYFTDERAQDAVGAVADDSGDVELHYETSPARRLWAVLSSAVQSALSAAVSALQPGDDVSQLTNDAGYLTDAPSDGDIYGRKDGAWEKVTTSGGGTVTSVGLSVPTGFQVSGSPVTTSGTLTVTYDTGYQGYTSAEASKLSGIAAGATVGADWSVNLSNIPANIASWAGIAPSAKVNTAGDTMTGHLILANNGELRIDNSAGNTRVIRLLTNGVNRWTIYANTTSESGGNVGSNLVIRRYADDGSTIGPDPLSINRATGVVSLGLRPTFAGAVPWDSANFDPSEVVPSTVAPDLPGANWDTQSKVGFFRGANSYGGTAPGLSGDYDVIQTFGSNGDGTQLAFHSGTRAFWRLQDSGPGTWTPWNEFWHTGNLADSGWTSISVGSGWSANNLARRRFGTRVKLRGSIENTSGTRAPGTIVLTLPAGYRPSTPTMFLVPTLVSGAGDYRRVAVGDNGDIALPDGLPGGVTFWLDGIDFYTD